MDGDPSTLWQLCHCVITASENKYFLISNLTLVQREAIASHPIAREETESILWQRGGLQGEKETCSAPKNGRKQSTPQKPKDEPLQIVDARQLFL